MRYYFDQRESEKVNAKDWFSEKKSKKMGNAISTFADSIGWGYVEDKFWEFTVGKQHSAFYLQGFLLDR